MTIEYHLVKSEEVNTFKSEREEFPNRSMLPHYRDYIMATSGNKIVGFAIMFDKEEGDYNSIQDVISLSNIEVLPEFRNQGIASTMIDMVLDEIKDRNKILKRTRPDPDGLKYIYNQITQKTEEKGVLVIPHNLEFIYEALEKNIFDKRVYSLKERIDTMYKIAHKILKSKEAIEHNMDSVDKLSNWMIEQRDEAMEEFVKESKKRTRRRRI